MQTRSKDHSTTGAKGKKGPKGKGPKGKAPKGKEAERATPEIQGLPTFRFRNSV